MRVNTRLDHVSFDMANFKNYLVSNVLLAVRMKIGKWSVSRDKRPLLGAYFFATYKAQDTQANLQFRSKQTNVSYKRQPFILSTYKIDFIIELTKLLRMAKNDVSTNNRLEPFISIVDLPSWLHPFTRLNHCFIQVGGVLL